MVDIKIAGAGKSDNEYLASGHHNLFPLNIETKLSKKIIEYLEEKQQ